MIWWTPTLWGIGASHVGVRALGDEATDGDRWCEGVGLL